MNHLIEFQKKNGLLADGVIGPKTLLKMRGVFGIQADAQLAHFLANIDHETGGFRADSENLNYSSVALANTFPKYFGAGKKLTFDYANKPEKIANYIYGNRMGNGSESTGDGWRFRGRGALQLTGKNNYKLFSDFMKDPEILANPDIVAIKYFWDSALFYFTVNRLWPQMKYADSESVKAIRKAVNGGSIGLEDVQKKFNYYYNLITKP